MGIEKIILLILMVLPYGFIGFELGNLIAVTVGIIYMFFKCEIVGDKKFILLTIIYFILGIVSTLLSDDILNAMVGIGPYLSLGVYYIVFNNICSDDNKQKKLLEYIVYIISGLSIVFIIVQCKIFNVRLEGAIGYANSYSLILLITIYLNNSILKNKYNNYINIILVTSILFTGSRTTMIFYIIYLGFELYKKEYIYIKDSILNNIIGLSMYILIDSYIGIVILLFPFIVMAINKLYNIKFKKDILVVLIIMGVVSIIIIPNNTFQRIKGISIKNGSFQERLVLFEDGVNAIIKQPKGYGINSYEKEIVYNHTANYQYSYIHNSLLQVSFELGIIGGLILVLLFIYGGKIIYINKGFSVDFIIYIIFILHSLMDFDFSFVTLIAIFTLLISINGQRENIVLIESKILIKWGYLVILTIIISISINEGMIMLGKTTLNKGNYEETKKIINNVPVKDYKAYSILADAYKAEYDDTNKKETLIIALDYNKTALEKNNRNSNIKWNIAYCYKELGDIERYIELMKNLSVANKYNKEYYDEFYKTISSINEESMQDEILEWIKNEFNKNKDNINSKSIYMKNQI